MGSGGSKDWAEGYKRQWKDGIWKIYGRFLKFVRFVHIVRF